ncbi:Uncharacterised protein [Mycobacteroides abscessus subsp. abscessus]|nr:Uncharacterised protein [Mycobacteroides abscessus subsp. abscessus]
MNQLVQQQDEAAPQGPVRDGRNAEALQPLYRHRGGLQFQPRLVDQPAHHGGITADIANTGQLKACVVVSQGVALDDVTEHQRRQRTLGIHDETEQTDQFAARQLVALRVRKRVPLRGAKERKPRCGQPMLARVQGRIPIDVEFGVVAEFGRLEEQPARRLESVPHPPAPGGHIAPHGGGRGEFVVGVVDVFVAAGRHVTAF